MGCVAQYAKGCTRPTLEGWYATVGHNGQRGLHHVSRDRTLLAGEARNEPAPSSPQRNSAPPCEGADAPRRVRRLIPAIHDQVLPRPTLEAWSWLLAARCRGEDVDVFFSGDGEDSVAARRRHRKAAALCAQCAVSSQCREYALKYQEPWGIWGGLNESERRRLSGENDGNGCEG
jgi:WhiB family redox-sensing transcriptional regulator